MQGDFAVFGRFLGCATVRIHYFFTESDKILLYLIKARVRLGFLSIFNCRFYIVYWRGKFEIRNNIEIIIHGGGISVFTLSILWFILVGGPVRGRGRQVGINPG